MKLLALLLNVALAASAQAAPAASSPLIHTFASLADLLSIHLRKVRLVRLLQIDAAYVNSRVDPYRGR